MRFLLIALSILSMGSLCANNYSTKVKVGGRDIEWTPENDSSLKRIDPKERSQDFEAAFRSLREADSQANTFVIVEGISINHVVEFTVMPNATMVILKFKHGKAYKSKAVRIEDISELGQR